MIALQTQTLRQRNSAKNSVGLTLIDEMGVPIMSEAIVAYRHVAASPELREAERMRSKARHDEAQALQNAKRVEREHWQGVVADKDAEIARLRAQLDKK